MAIYFIKLFPLGRFFFGGENTFGDNNSDNYFVRSMYFPQQTTLLGMIRHQLLIQNDLLDINGKIFEDEIEAAQRLIGNKSFSDDNTLEYGKIKGLSPVFITGPDGDYFVQAREYGLKMLEDQYTGEKCRKIIPLFLHPMNGSQKDDALKDVNSYYMEHLDAKTIIPDLLVNARDRKMLFFEDNPKESNEPMNGIFLPDEKVGIRKNDFRFSNEKGYYKQVGFQMKKEFSFSFYLDLDNINVFFKDNKQYVFNEIPTLIQMGTDQSWFRMEVKMEKGSINSKLKEKTEGLFNTINTKYEKVVLLSDTLVNSDIYNKCLFASTETVAFKFYETEIASGKYSRKAKNSKQYLLLKKGSVFYCENKTKREKLSKEIFNETAPEKPANAFNIIGYNFDNQSINNI